MTSWTGLIFCAWLVTSGYIWLKATQYGTQAREFLWRLLALNTLTLSLLALNVYLWGLPGGKMAALRAGVLAVDLGLAYIEQKLWRQAIED